MAAEMVQHNGQELGLSWVGIMALLTTVCLKETRCL